MFLLRDPLLDVIVSTFWPEASASSLLAYESEVHQREIHNGNDREHPYLDERGRRAARRPTFGTQPKSPRRE